VPAFVSCVLLIIQLQTRAPASLTLHSGAMASDCITVAPTAIFHQIGTGSDDVEPVAHVNVAASFVDTAALRGCITNAPFTDHTIAARCKVNQVSDSNSGEVGTCR